MKHGNLLVERTTTGPFAVNTYLVGCGETHQAVIIDPGGDGQRLLAMAEKHQFEVTKLLLTHGHIDHIAGLKEIQEATGAPIYLHSDDKTIYDTADMQGLFFGLRVRKPPQADESVSEGDRIDIGNSTALVLHTPGHSAGSVCYYLKAEGILFSGDLLFKGSIGRTDLPSGNGRAMMASLNRIVEECSDETVVYPGHMGITTIGEERRSNPFLSGGW